MRARFKACILSLLLPLAVANGQDIGLLRLAPDTSGSRGSASVWGGYEDGGYRPGFAPSSQWKAGASAKGTRHGSITSYTGSFSFEQLEGKDMFTSMFLEPGYFPVDVLEFTPGSKTRQTYKMSGGFATSIYADYIIGLNASYSAANYSKRKDIRHTTYGMDLQLEPTFAVGEDGNGASISYVFRKRTESIDAEQIGSAIDESYYAFLDKGMRYGTYQVWDGDGIHLDEAGVGVFPVKEYTNGFSYVFLGPGFSGGMKMLWKNGRVGEKGYDWFRYSGFDINLSFERIWASGHSASMNWDIQIDGLKEAVLDKETSGGVTTPVVYGYNAVSDRGWMNLELTYGYRFREGCLKGVRAVLKGGLWDESSYLMYPYEDGSVRANVNAVVLASFGFGPVDLNLRVNGGAGTWKEQGLTGGTDEVLTTPFRLQADWDRKMEYFSTAKLGAGITATYHLKTLKGLSIKADGGWLHGFGVVLLPGSERWNTTLSINYDY